MYTSVYILYTSVYKVYTGVDKSVYSMYTNLYTGCRQGVDNMASKVVSTRLHESMVDELDLKASGLGITRNELIARVLLDFLDVDDFAVDKSVDSDVLKLVDNAVDNRIQFLIERIDSLENAIANIKTSETTAPKKAKPLALIAA